MNFVGEVLDLLWQGALIVLWFYIGRWNAHNMEITLYSRFAWVNDGARLLTAPVVCFLVCGGIWNLGDGSLRDFGVVWIARSIAAMLGTVWGWAIGPAKSGPP